jgi:hypothetical protein
MHAYDTTTLPLHERRGINLHPCPVIEMPQRPRVIGLAGRMGAGKDTVAALLRMRGYERIAFADALKAEVVAAIESRSFPEILWKEHPDIAAIIHTGAATPESVTTRPYLSWMRVLLQWWGTEYRRTQDPLYWIQRLAESVHSEHYSVSDVRFANEAGFIQSIGGEVWLVHGRTTSGGIEGHASEALTGVVPDKTIDNSGSLYDLAVAVTGALSA